VQRCIAFLFTVFNYGTKALDKVKDLALFMCCQLVKSHVKQTCSRWINDSFNERGGKEVTVERKEESQRTKTLRVRVSEIRHRANFPKAER